MLTRCRMKAVTAAGWFLIASIVGLAFTLNALRPRRRPVFLLGFSFFSAWLTTELAIFHLAWQVVVTAAFVAAGALDSWPGYVGRALTCCSWIGLAWIVRVSLGTGAVMDAALGAIATSVTSDAPNGEAPASATISWARVLLPSPRRPGVTKIRNLA